MDERALQDRYAPASRCFGCGPANPEGLQVRSFVADDGLVATWAPEPRYEAFENALNGGVCGTLLDCHANWAAVHRFLEVYGGDVAPGCVTAELTVRFLRPTPTREGAVILRSRVVDLAGERATVEASITAPNGTQTATARGVFVRVGPGHPAYDRWRA